MRKILKAIGILAGPAYIVCLFTFTEQTTAATGAVLQVLLNFIELFKT